MEKYLSISTLIYENPVSKHSTSSVTKTACLYSLFPVFFPYVFFLGCFVIRDLRRRGGRGNFGEFAFFLTSPPPFLPRGCFPSLPRILCLTQVTVI